MMWVPFWSVLQWRSCGGFSQTDGIRRPSALYGTLPHTYVYKLSPFTVHTHHIDVHTKDSCPYLPTFKTGLITSQSSVTQWALDNKRRGVGDHNFTELHQKGSFVRTNKPSNTMMMQMVSTSPSAPMLRQHNLGYYKFSLCCSEMQRNIDAESKFDWSSQDMMTLLTNAN